MGHDIDIVDSNGNSVDHTYISGNFTRYDKYAEGIHAMHGHTGKTVAKIARRSLQKLKDRGTNIDPIPSTRPNWFYAVDENGKSMSLESSLEVYAVHLRSFCRLGDAYPDCRFFSDQVWVVTPYEDDEYESEGETNDSD